MHQGEYNYEYYSYGNYHYIECAICNNYIDYEDCIDEDGDGYCDKCNGCMHQGEYNYEYCSYGTYHYLKCVMCNNYFNVENCKDEDGDGYCDYCHDSISI
jgi:hypothetical protein